MTASSRTLDRLALDCILSLRAKGEKRAKYPNRLILGSLVDGTLRHLVPSPIQEGTIVFVEVPAS